MGPSADDPFGPCPVPGAGGKRRSTAATKLSGINTPLERAPKCVHGETAGTTACSPSECSAPPRNASPARHRPAACAGQAVGLPRRSRLLPFPFECPFGIRLRLGDELGPRRRVHEGVGVAGLALREQLR